MLRFFFWNSMFMLWWPQAGQKWLACITWRTCHPCIFFGNCRVTFTVTGILWTGYAFDNKLAFCPSFLLRQWWFFHLLWRMLDSTKPPTEAHVLSSATFRLVLIASNIVPDGWLDSFCRMNERIRAGDDEPIARSCSASMFWKSSSDEMAIKQSGFSPRSWIFMQKLPLTVQMLVTWATRSAYEDSQSITTSLRFLSM